jgi:hypothetical protein
MFISSETKTCISAQNDNDSDDQDPLFQIINTFQLGGREDSSRSNKPAERPEVLSKPEAKPKYSFIDDFVKM